MPEQRTSLAPQHICPSYSVGQYCRRINTVGRALTFSAREVIHTSTGIADSTLIHERIQRRHVFSMVSQSS